MRTFIRPMIRNHCEETLNILREHVSIYQEIETVDTLNTTMYSVLDENGKQIAFFGISRFEFETVLSCVYVYEEYRKLGIFNKMVKFVKNTMYESNLISIGASYSNELANLIYAKKFKYLGSNKDGIFYAIKDTRK